MSSHELDELHVWTIKFLHNLTNISNIYARPNLTFVESVSDYLGHNCTNTIIEEVLWINFVHSFVEKKEEVSKWYQII